MSIILAKVFALYFFGVGLAFLLNPQNIGKVYRLIEKDELFLFFGGIMALVIGAFIVSVHNIWMLHWTVAITILGWWSVVKGLVLICYPGCAPYLTSMFQGSKRFYRGIGLILISFGLFFAYHSWFLIS